MQMRDFMARLPALSSGSIRCGILEAPLSRMIHRRNRGALPLFALVLMMGPPASDAALAQLRGHGGPVRALAISPDGETAISASFDSTAIRWSLAHNAAEQVLRFHADAVNAVVLL